MSGELHVLVLMQCPLEHFCCCPHLMPHPPQLLESDVMSVQVVPHTILGELHFLGSPGRGGVNLELARVAKIRIKTATILILNMLQLHVSVVAYNLREKIYMVQNRDLEILKVGHQYVSFKND